MANAKNVHRRSGALQKAVKLPAAENPITVPVSYNPKATPQEEFKEFYPLHVTKVASTSKSSPLALVLWSVLVIAVAIVAGLYVVSKQEHANNEVQAPQNTLSAATSNQLTSVSPSNVSKNSIVNIGSIQTGPSGLHKYINQEYGFQLSLPVSWSNAVMTDVTGTDELSPVALIDFSLPTGTAEAIRLMQLRVDSPEGYTAFSSALTKQKLAVPAALLTTSQYVISAPYKLLSDQKVSGSSDTDTILRSIAIYNPE